MSKEFTKISKIVKYMLEEDLINLRKSGLSYDKIADELNNSGKVPADDSIDKFVVMRFLEKMPEISKEIVRESKHRLIQVVNTNMDIIFEVNSMFQKTKNIMEQMETDANDKGKMIDVYRWKAVVGEMREMLGTMGAIQREINDYNNVRRFMEVVIETLSDECPEKIPAIVDRLRTTKGTQWFADILSSKDKK
jgi:hypothetical protein